MNKDNCKHKECNILLAGVGGQGTIVASKILAEVAMQSGLDVKMSEIHGMAQRGGSVITQVKMGEKVYSPLVEKSEAHILLAFEQLEALRWLEYLRPDGKVIVNTQIIDPLPVILGKAEYPSRIAEKLKERVHSVTEVDALEKAASCGNPKTANVVMIGVLARKMAFAKEVWIQALRAKVPPQLFAINRQAFEKGYMC